MAVCDDGMNESVTLVLGDLSIIQVQVHPQVLSHVPILQPRPDTHSAAAAVKELTVEVQHSSSGEQFSVKKQKIIKYRQGKKSQNAGDFKV